MNGVNGKQSGEDNRHEWLKKGMCEIKWEFLFHPIGIFSGDALLNMSINRRRKDHLAFVFCVSSRSNCFVSNQDALHV